MGYFKVDFWELLLHLLGIILWSMTIIYLIWDRMNRNRSSLRYSAQENFKGFSDEIHFQLIKRQAEKTLQTLSDTIDREQRVLQELVEKRKKEDGNSTFRVKKSYAPLEPALEPKDNASNRDISIIETDPYGEVVRLSELGMSEEKISEKVRISKSEISLIRRLKGYTGNFKAKTELRAEAAS